MKKKENSLHPLIEKCYSKIDTTNILNIENSTQLSELLKLNPVELYPITDTRENVSSAKKGKRDTFYEFETLEDSINAMKYGYDTAIEKLDKELKKDNRLGKIASITHRYDVIGSRVSVPRALIGHPQNMHRDVKIYKPAKSIILYKNCSVSSGVNKSKIIDSGKKTCQIIMLLEAMGYQVQLNAVMCASGQGEEHLHIFKLKDYTDTFNLRKYAFYLVSPDFLRRICFKLLEISPTWIGGGYGCPIPQNTARQYLDMLQGKNKQHYVYIDTIIDMDIDYILDNIDDIDVIL